MKFITGPRCSGKTTALIEESSKTGIPIISPTRAMAEYAKRMAKDYGVDIPAPVSIGEVVKQGGKRGKYLVDELELCLSVLGIDAVTATVCIEEEEK
jgi:hypothetical protein